MMTHGSGCIRVLGMCLWTTPHGRKAFGRALAAKQRLYNGFVATGFAWGRWLGGAQGQAAQMFFLGCVIVAGVSG